MTDEELIEEKRIEEEEIETTVEEKIYLASSGAINMVEI